MQGHLGVPIGAMRPVNDCAEPGTIVRKGSKVAKAHPELFEPLTVEAEFDHLNDG